MMTYVWSSVVACLHPHLHCSNVLVHSTSFSARSFDRALPLHARGHAPPARRHWEGRYDTEQHRYPRAEVMARRCYIELYRSSCHIYFTIAWLASVGPPASCPPAHYCPPSPMSSPALRSSVKQELTSFMPALRSSRRCPLSWYKLVLHPSSCRTNLTVAWLASIGPPVS